MTTDALLSHLWRDGEWGYYWTPDGEWYYSRKYDDWRQEKISLWFPLAGRWPAVPAAWQDKNVYFAVHPASVRGEKWQRSRIDTVAAVNAVFAEYDVPKHFPTKQAILDHLDRAPLYPTCIVDSGGGYHCFWFIEYPQPITEENRGYWRKVQGAWVDLVGGDDGAKDLARVLRLPGYHNRKPERGPDFPEVKVIEYGHMRLFPVYRITELVDERIAEQEAAERRRIEEDQARGDYVAGGAAEFLLEWAVNHAQSGSRHTLALWLADKLKKENIGLASADSTLKKFAERVNKDGERQLTAAEMSNAARYVYKGGGG